jgi:hypothetical protein
MVDQNLSQVPFEKEFSAPEKRRRLWISAAQKSLVELPGSEGPPASTGNSLFKQGIGQLEALTFIGAGIEDHQRTGAETFNFAYGVLAKLAPLV